MLAACRMHVRRLTFSSCVDFIFFLCAWRVFAELRSATVDMSGDPLDAVGQGHGWYGYNLVRAESVL